MTGTTRRAYDSFCPEHALPNCPGVWLTVAALGLSISLLSHVPHNVPVPAVSEPQHQPQSILYQIIAPSASVLENSLKLFRSHLCS